MTRYDCLSPLFCPLCGGDVGDGPAKLKNRLEPSDDCPANGENCKDDNDDEDNNMKI